MDADKVLREAPLADNSDMPLLEFEDREDRIFIRSLLRQAGIARAPVALEDIAALLQKEIETAYAYNANEYAETLRGVLDEVRAGAHFGTRLIMPPRETPSSAIALAYNQIVLTELPPEEILAELRKKHGVEGRVLVDPSQPRTFGNMRKCMNDILTTMEILELASTREVEAQVEVFRNFMVALADEAGIGAIYRLFLQEHPEAKQVQSTRVPD